MSRRRVPAATALRSPVRGGRLRFAAVLTAAALVGGSLLSEAPPAQAISVSAWIDEVLYVVDTENPTAGANVAGYSGGPVSSLTIPDTVTVFGIPYPVTAIGSGGHLAFYGTSLGAVTLPDSVINIGDNAFRNAGMTSLTLGAGVQTIGAQSFSSDQGVPDANSLGSLVIPDSVTSIGEYAFSRAGVTSLNLGVGVQTIGERAFAVNAVGPVVIPDSVTSIGYRAFGDAGMTTLDLGVGVQAIDGYAFYNNPGTRPLVIPDSVTSIGDYAFSSTPVSSLDLGVGVKTIGEWAFNSGTFTSVTIPASVISIGSLAFAHYSLTTVRFQGAAPTITVAGPSGSFGNAAGKTLSFLPQFGVDAGVAGGYETPFWRGYNTGLISQVTVAFEANGHGTAPAPETVPHGGQATEPSDPVAAGWVFTGWYTDPVATAPYDFAVPVITDLTLYAGWTQTREVTFVANGHGTAPAPETVPDGGQATEPSDPSAAGWTFTGWFTDVGATSPYVFTTAVTADLILYAGWVQQTREVTFVANGHGTAPAPETVPDGGQATEPSDPSAAGWTFTGWFTDVGATSPYVFTTAVTADLILYAGWVQQTREVTFVANGHGTAPAVATVPDGGPVTEPSDPSAAGWTFTGWFTDVGATSPYVFTTPVTADLTLYAGWVQQTREVTFVANGHGTAPAVATVPDGGPVTEPSDPSAAGWTFTGWFTDDTATTPYVFTTPVTADLLLYAGWELTPVPTSVAGAVTVSATVGDAFSYTPVVGGIPTSTVTHTGVLPTGLILNLATGAITGTPVDDAGDYPVTLIADNGVGSPATLNLTITLTAGAATVLIAVTPSAVTVDQGGTVTLTATGADSAGNPVTIPAADMVYSSSVASDVIEGNRVTFPHASPHTITGIHTPTGLVITTAIEVTPAPTAIEVTPAPIAIATTGANPLSLIVGALGLLAAGLAALTVGLIARRREAVR